jgi:RimJ/RimL family protein N-acetyltransferase
MKSIKIETERLLLRPWRASDSKCFFRINHDPNVTAYLPGSLTMQEVEDFIQRQQENLKKHMYCLWAAEVKATEDLIGFIGLNWTDFLNKTEIGWRLCSEHWGKGYATEGAKAVLEYGFNKVHNLNEIVSFTVPDNTRSIMVMERIGMKRDFTADFNHPKIPLGHRLSKHILYRKCKENS